MGVNFSCCQNCKDRTVGCHSTCEKYLKDKQEHNKLKEINDNQRRLNNNMYSLSMNRAMKVKSIRNKSK